MAYPILPPMVVNLDDADDPADVLDAVLLGSFVAGIHPAARWVRLERVRPDAALLPPGITASRVAEGNGVRSRLAEGPGWTLRAVRWQDACALVTVVADTEQLAASVLAQAVKGACEPEHDDGATISTAFWHRACDGRVRRNSRDLAAVSWSQIRGNYPAAAAGALERTMAIHPDTLGGRLLLLHGPPGTGKTTALRALSSAWRTWCRTEVVVDAERLYGDAAYLMTVMLGRDDDEGAEAARWRLLILEDCDELIRADAKREVGQALGRLLNLTDGLIGQGLRLLVALTTNEPLGALHPAIVRPGRCLAEIHIGRLSRTEATGWLGSARDVPADGATLAELYQLRAAQPSLRAPELRPVSGLYL